MDFLASAILVVALLLISVGISAWRDSVTRRRWRHKVGLRAGAQAAAWQQVQQSLGGVATDLLPEEPSGGHPFVVDVHGTTLRVGYGWNEEKIVTTVVSRAACAPDGLRLKVAGPGLLQNTKEWPLRRASVPLGTTSARVWSNSAELSRVWVDRQVAEPLLTLPGAVLCIEEGHAEGTVPGVAKGDQLEKLIHAVARLARRGEELIEGWREVGQSLGGTLPPPPERAGGVSWPEAGLGSIAIPRGAQEILVDVSITRSDYTGDLGVDTSVTCHFEGGLGKFRIHVPEGAGEIELTAEDVELGAAADQEAFDRWFTQETADALADLSPRRITGDHRGVTVTLGGLELDPEWLERAIDLTASAAGAASSGPYR